MTPTEFLQALLAGHTLTNGTQRRHLVSQGIELSCPVATTFICNNIPMDTSSWYIAPATININGYEVPEPLRTAPEPGSRYYVASTGVDIPSRYEWLDDDVDYLYLARGIVHLTKEDASLHAKALLSFTEAKS
jgi:hypothetical protein